MMVLEMEGIPPTMAFKATTEPFTDIHLLLFTMDKDRFGTNS